MRLHCALLCMLGVVGCRSQPPAEAAPELGDEVQHLIALGYVDYAPQAQLGASGLIVHDEARSHPGYNLYPIRALGRAELVDERGELVHAWTRDGERAWRRAALLEGGDLLVVGGVAPDTYVLRLDRDSNEVWRVPVRAHHDVGLAPDGRVVTLTKDARLLPGVHPTLPVRDDSITLIDPAGPTFESVSLVDAIAASGDVLRLQEVAAAEGQVDVVHANSVRFVERPPRAGDDPLYDPGNLVVCMRQQDTVGILDWDERRFLWAWGQGVLEAPHDATVLDDGHVLVFDNGVRRGWSRVVEVDPATNEIVWEYRAAEPADFFTHARGSAQRLPNGNTLIAESNSGRGFEVTPDGAIVWDFYQPHLDLTGRRATIIRFYRYEPSLVEPFLARSRDDPTP